MTTKARVNINKKIIKAVNRRTVVRAISQKTAVKAVSQKKVIKAVQKVVKTIVVKVSKQGPQGPPGPGPDETFTHPSFFTTSARDTYYTLNPTLLIDELIVTVNNGSIRDMWQYKLSTATWIAIGSAAGGGVSNPMTENLDADGFTVNGLKTATEYSEAVALGQRVAPMLRTSLTNFLLSGKDEIVTMGLSTDWHYNRSDTGLREPLCISEMGNLASDFDSHGNVDFSFQNADLVQNGNGTDDIATLDAALRPSRSPLFHTFGNHDGNSQVDVDSWQISIKALYAAESTPVTWGGLGGYYSFERNGLLILVLDTEQADAGDTFDESAHYIGETQRAWITSILQANPTTPCIVQTHRSLNDDPSLSAYYQCANAAVIRGLLEADGNVIVCFSGHAHSELPTTGGNTYNTVKGIKYFTLTSSSLNSGTECYSYYEGAIIYINKRTGDVYKEAIGTAVPLVGTSSGSLDEGTTTNLYLDSAGTGDGYSEGTGAVATVAELQALIPKPFTTNVICHLSGEDWSSSTLTFSGVRPDGDFKCKIQGARPTPDVSGSLTANASVVGTDPGFYTLTDPGAFTALSLAGKFVEFTKLAGNDIESDNENVYAYIISHTDDVLTVDGSQLRAAITGDTYHVYSQTSIAPKTIAEKGTQGIELRRIISTASGALPEMHAFRHVMSVFLMSGSYCPSK